MADPLDNERLRFYLRHRDDIREWAAIERDVILATRELLALTQEAIEDRVVGIDPTISTERRDGSRWERVFVRRPTWPDAVGVALEWEVTVDPFSAPLPKYGVCFLNMEATWEAARLRMVDAARATPQLIAAGYKVPGDRVWPAVRWVAKSKDWWKDPQAWAASIIDEVADLWPIGAAVIDRGLDAVPEPPASVDERQGISGESGGAT